MNIKKHFFTRCLCLCCMVLTLQLSIYSAFPAFSTAVELDTDAHSAEFNDSVTVSTEISAYRGAFEKHFLLSDGSFAAVSYAEQVHYQNNDGQWEEVDNRLSFNRSTKRIENAYNAFKTSFAENDNATDLVSIQTGASSISWTIGATKISANPGSVRSITANHLRAQIPSTPTLQSEVRGTVEDHGAFTQNKISGKVEYESLFTENPEVSVRYTVFHNKIEEDIFINEPTDLCSFTLQIRAQNMNGIVNCDGSVSFLNEIGETLFRIGIPYMEDADGDVLNDIQVSLTQNGDFCLITYTPNQQWFHSQDRKYPILFDPSVTSGDYYSSITDTYVVEGDTNNHSSEQKLYLGIRSGKVHRTYIRFNTLPNIDTHMPIIGATLQVFLTNGTNTGKTAQLYKANAYWNPITVTYANQPFSGNTIDLLDTCSFSASDGYYSFNIGQHISEVYEAIVSASDNGFVLKYQDESLTNPDYNAVYSSEYITSAKRPLLTVRYGYALPASLTNGESYAFMNWGSGSYMTVHDGIDANNTNVYQKSFSNFSSLTSKNFFKLEKVATTGGYYLRAKCSSDGSNRVLDIAKYEGYVVSGCNVQLFNPTDAIAQHWYIVGVGAMTFKIIPRTNMALALTAQNSSADGTATGTTASSMGNIFVWNYDDTNDYQKWVIIDENDNEKSGGMQVYDDGVYYLNNKSTGKYLHKATTTSLNITSGTISSLENTIRWKVSYIGDGKYIIQSIDLLTKFLYNNGSQLSLSNAPSSGEFSDYYKWTISLATGGGWIIRNASTGKYLCAVSTYLSVSNSLGQSGTDLYNRRVWRAAKDSEYGNCYPYTQRELMGFSIDTCIADIGETKTLSITKTPSNACWADPTDFTYSYSSGTENNLTENDYMITANSIGITTFTATHKVTGLSYSYTVYVDRYTYELVNYFGFEPEPAILIRDIYNRMDTAYSTSSAMYKAWATARMLSEFTYDGVFNAFYIIEIDAWNIVAGSVTTNETRESFFTQTLGYTSNEYNTIKQALRSQHQSASANLRSDYTHMQYSLSARLAYSINAQDFPSLTGLALTEAEKRDISYFGGWLGDAVLIENGTTQLGFSDYLADLDAENVYQMLLLNADSISVINQYYANISNGANRAEIFLTSTPYIMVQQYLLDYLDMTIEEIRPCYPNTYDFLMSLYNEQSILQHY